LTPPGTSARQTIQNQEFNQVAVKIRLKRMGKKFAPFYRVVVLDSRKKRDGRVIEEIGVYDPMQEPSLISIDSERVQYWLGVGAQPSDAVYKLIKITGDYHQFKGLKGVESTLKVKDADAAAVAKEAEASSTPPSQESLDEVITRQGGTPTGYSTKQSTYGQAAVDTSTAQVQGVQTAGAVVAVPTSSGTYVRIAVTAGSAEEVDTIVSTILTTVR